MARRVELIRTGFTLAALLAYSACVCSTRTTGNAEVAVERTAVEALAGVYNLAAAESSVTDCRVSLSASAAGREAHLTTYSLSLSDGCRELFAALGAARFWAWTGGASISFLGGDPIHEVAHFSPVQDASGVFLRGGLAGEAGVYELRPANS
jgi:hypothetical protein